MRIKIKISYNGNAFFGSQAQKETKQTVLGVLQDALLSLGIESKITASGRTDRGVHATGQICHCDIPDFWSNTAKLKELLNRLLPSSAHISSLEKVADSFHARYDAKSRVYRYIIKEGESNPFLEQFITFLPTADFNEIASKISIFCGEHDFSGFMKSGGGSESSIRVIYRAFAYRYKGFIVLNFEANGFLRSQIRLMAGALLTLSASQLSKQLTLAKIHKIKPAPANGLYLAKVKYE